MVKNQDYQLSDVLLALALLAILLVTSTGGFPGF
jgi:hypothetical protein